VAITNTDNTFHASRPDEIHVGAGNRLELDLWYHIPLATDPHHLRDTVCSTTIPMSG
jgi:hypothetical protein